MFLSTYLTAVKMLYIKLHCQAFSQTKTGWWEGLGMRLVIYTFHFTYSVVFTGQLGSGYLDRSQEQVLKSFTSQS